MIALIDTFVEPQVRELGFIRTQPWEFVRIRDEMIDVVSIVRIRGSQIHKCGFYTNLLCEPFGKVLQKIKAGEQVTRNLDSGFVWNATDDCSHEVVFRDIQDFIAGHVSDFFDRMTVRGFLERIRYTRSGLYLQSECMCLSLLDESLELISEHCTKDYQILAERSVDDYTPGQIEKTRSTIAATEKAYESGQLPDLIRTRKLRNLKEAKLHKNEAILAQAGFEKADFDSIEI